MTGRDMERLTLDDLATAAGGTLPSPADRRVACDGVAIDSRGVRRGDVFWAIGGPNFDGHDFLPDAARRGAVAAVVSRQIAESPLPLVVVPETVAALGRFAAWYRRLHDAVVIGVTGSVGKTTTRELLFHALGGDDAAVRSRRNFNNRLGLPLTLCDLERRHRFAVTEIGASRPGEVAALSEIARPEVGVVTYFGVAHLADFGGEDAIVAAKSELLEAIPAAGFAVLPGDQRKAHRAAARCRGAVLMVGRDSENHVRIEPVSAEPGRLRFRIDRQPFEVNANGAHVAVNAGMAIAVARRLGRTDAAIAADLRAFEPVPGRGRVVIAGPWTVIDDAYNANPDSMRAALDALAAWPAAGRRVFVAGDMYGLGDVAEAAHVAFGREAAARGIDLLAAIGAHAGRTAHGARRQGMDARRLAAFADRAAAAEFLRGELRPGDVVWLKGSRPMELERLVDELRPAARRAA